MLSPEIDLNNLILLGFGSWKRIAKHRADPVSEQVFWTMDWLSPSLL